MKTSLKLAATVFMVATIGIVNADPPTNSGVVTRGSYTNAWFDVDMKNGLSSVVGVDIVELCNGPADFDVFYYSDKLVQKGLRINTLEKAELTASVWPFTVYDCDRFRTMAPLAVGTATLVSRDNDLFGPQFCEEKNNINSFRRKANGTLYSPSGEAKQFNLHVWGLYDCDTDSFDLFKTKINLTD